MRAASALWLAVVVACTSDGERESRQPEMVTVPAGPVRGILDPCSDEVIEAHVDAFEIDYEPVTRERFRQWLLANPTRLGREKHLEAYRWSEVNGYLEVKDRMFAVEYCKDRGLEPPTVSQLRRAGAGSSEQWEWGNHWRHAPVCIVPGYIWCFWKTTAGVVFLLDEHAIAGDWATSRRCLRPFPYDVTGRDRESSRKYRFLRTVLPMGRVRCVRSKQPTETRATGA